MTVTGLKVTLLEGKRLQVVNESSYDAQVLVDRTEGAVSAGSTKTFSVPEGTYWGVAAAGEIVAQAKAPFPWSGEVPGAEEIDAADTEESISPAPAADQPDTPPAQSTPGDEDAAALNGPAEVPPPGDEEPA